MILIILLIIFLSGLALTNLIELLTDWIEPKKGLKVQVVYISDILEIICEIIAVLVISYILLK